MGFDIAAIVELIGVENILGFLGKWLKDEYKIESSKVIKTADGVVLVLRGKEDTDRVYKDLVLAMKYAGLIESRKIKIKEEISDGE